MLLIINIIKCILDQLKQTPENIETVVPSRPLVVFLKQTQKHLKPFKSHDLKGFLILGVIHFTHRKTKKK